MLKLTRQQKQALWEVFRRDWKRPTAKCPDCRGDGGGFFFGFFEITDRFVCKRCNSTGEVDSYLAFRRGVVPMFGFGGGVTVPYCGMILAIEPDGHTHS